MAKKVNEIAVVEEVKGSKKIEEAVQMTKEVKEIKKEEKVDKVEVAEVEVKKANPIQEVMNEKFMNEINTEELIGLTFQDAYKTYGLKAKIKSNFELVMLTKQTRKSYILVMVDLDSGENIIIGDYKSIMECKVFTMKFSAITKKEIKIHFFKPGRKNQASERISEKTYADKMAKYTI